MWNKRKIKYFLASIAWHGRSCGTVCGEYAGIGAGGRCGMSSNRVEFYKYFPFLRHILEARTILFFSFSSFSSVRLCVCQCLQLSVFLQEPRPTKNNRFSVSKRHLIHSHRDIHTTVLWHTYRTYVFLFLWIFLLTGRIVAMTTNNENMFRLRKNFFFFCFHFFWQFT